MYEFPKRDPRTHWWCVGQQALVYISMLPEVTVRVKPSWQKRFCYAVESKRTNSVALERFCTHFNYEPMVFGAEGENGVSKVRVGR